MRHRRALCLRWTRRTLRKPQQQHLPVVQSFFRMGLTRSKVFSRLLVWCPTVPLLKLVVLFYLFLRVLSLMLIREGNATTLHALIKDGDYFLATALCNTLAKLGIAVILFA